MATGGGKQPTFRTECAQRTVRPLKVCRAGLCLVSGCTVQVTLSCVTEALPLGRMQLLSCELPARTSGVPDAHESWRIRFRRGCLERLQRRPPNMKCLRVTTGNCGDLGTDPCKEPRLIPSFCAQSRTSSICRG